jgi:hypothetical protein
VTSTAFRHAAGPPWRAGLALAAAYGAVAFATGLLATGGDRPLFDGFAPRAPYRWVRPPPELAPTNQPPQSAERTIPLAEQGSEAANASTTDAQIILTLPGGSVPAHPPDTAVALRLTPLDAGTLAPLPPGLRAVANAYQVAMAYQPSGTEVSNVAPAAILALTANTRGDVLLYSPDGQSWQQTPSRPFGGTDGLTGSFRGPGYYLVTASPAVRATTTPGGGGSGTGSSILVAAVVALAAGAVVGGVAFLRQRRS